METKTSTSPDWNSLEMLIEEMSENQKKDLLKLATRIIPTVTSEDILQPNDYPELENHCEFRYEEGVLAGIQSVHIAFRSHLKSILSPS
jgi:hypothetical protein